jgi:hypothetical protein
MASGEIDGRCASALPTAASSSTNKTIAAVDAVVIERVPHQLVWLMTSTGDQIAI